MREGSYKDSIFGNDSISFRKKEIDAFTPYLEDSFKKKLGLDELYCYILRRLSRSLVPLPLLLTIAGRSGFKGISLIEQAAAAVNSDNPEELFPTKRHGIGKRDPDEKLRESLDEARKYSLKEAFELIFEGLGERRLDQLEMALAVRSTLEEGKAAFIEAGTGTGKSLAYLIPALLFSLETGNRLIISTYTKNLQNQLFNREIGLIRDILGLDIRAERLVGRENYICARRLIATVSKFMSNRPEDALDLVLSALFSETGTVETLPARRLEINLNTMRAPVRCLMNGCVSAKSCPLLIAREKAAAADIVFVNHALVMADYGGGGGVLGDYQSVIFDEAHHLEKCVMENLSIRIGPREISGLIKWIKPVSTQDDRWKFLLRELEAAPGETDWQGRILKLADLVTKTEEAWRDIFKEIEGGLNPKEAISQTKTRYFDGEEAFVDARDEIDRYYLYNNELREELKVLYKHRGSNGIRSFQQDIETVERELEELAAAATFLTKGCDEETVFWIEWNDRSKIRSICGAPINIDRRFADFLNDSCESVLFTSATLSQNGSFDYIKKRLGLRFSSKPVFELIKPSSFLRDDNCLVILHSETGDPNERAFSKEIVNIVRGLAGRHKRRLLVLFTSYRMCLQSALELDKVELPGPLLVQGRGDSREILSQKFRGTDASVLLGVASFWEGVDFPGDQLEILVIPKIPFPVPDEPITQARSEKLKAMGGNPFQELFLPEAILRLRQGIGRLIRRRDDRGVVVILDSRIHSRSYGKYILSSLPTEGVVASSGDEVIKISLDWFAE